MKRPLPTYYRCLVLKSDQTTISQNTLGFQLPIGKTIYVKWGDGTTTTLNGNSIILLEAVSSYTIKKNYTISIFGDFEYLTGIYIYNNTNISGDISGWSVLTNLNYLYCYNTLVSGDVSSWSTLTNLTNLWCHNTSITGDVSSWSSLVNLITLMFHNTSVSGNIAGWYTLTNLVVVMGKDTSVTGDIGSFATLVNVTTLIFWNTSVTYATATLPASWNVIYFNDCVWTTTMVDAFLNDLADVCGIGGTLNLAGTNSGRSSASDDAIETLTVTNSWAVTTN